MRKFFSVLVALMICSFSSSAESFEGVLRVEYKDEAGKTNTAEVFVKGDKYYIKKIVGGCEKYSAYILDLKANSLSCLNDRNPKTATSFNPDKVLGLYEKGNLKPGYKTHESQPYVQASATKSIGEIAVSQRRVSLDTMTYEIWTGALKIDYHSLIPVLRIAGFWNKEEDGTNAILEGKTTNKITNKTTTVSVTPSKMTVSEKLFEVPKDYQVVDLNKFISDQSSSPKIGQLVKAFAGF
jgi:hypothetical protein